MKVLFFYKYLFYQPLGIMYLSSFLKKEGHQTYFIDIKFERDIKKEVSRISPDLICYSATTGPHIEYRELNLKLKKHFNFISIFGGSFPTFYPDLIYEDGIDIIVQGEAEKSLVKIANAVQNNEDYTGIENTWVKKDGKIYKNEIGNLINDLDELPYPDWDLLDKYPAYRKSFKKSIMASRGCPYKCTYCWNGPYSELVKGKGTAYRLRSVESVISEAVEIKKRYKLRMLRFWDDTFIINKKWTLRFCELYKEKVNVPFRIFARIDLVDEEIVKALKDAGCIMVDFGKESGNENLRANVLKRGNYSNEKSIQSSLLFKKYGISTMSLNIMCLPDETLDMAFETLMLNIKSKVTYAYSTVFQPYPSTELGKYCIEKGYFDGFVGNVKKSFIFHGSSLNIPNLKEKIRLHYLFSYGVAFPFLYPLIKTLIRLPLTGLYKLLFIFFKVWNYYFKVYEIDRHEVFHYILSYINIFRKRV